MYLFCQLLAVHAACFVSGMCGLGQQMVWTRKFGIGLGHELPAVLAVVTAFFGGLALGAGLLDRSIGRTTRPGRWFGALEIVIGVWGIMLVGLLPLANEMALGMIGRTSSSLRHWLAAFLVPLLALLPATMAMGATLPAMEGFIAPFTKDRKCVGILYAVNTLGAVVGTLLTTLLAVPALGFNRTLLALAAMNILTGAVILGVEFKPRNFRSSLKDPIHPRQSVGLFGGFAPPFPSPQPSPLGRGRTGSHMPLKSVASDWRTAAAENPSPWGEGQGEGKGDESKSRCARTEKSPEMALAQFHVWRLDLVLFFTGLLGIGFEVLGVRVLSEVLENTIFTFAASLSVYLLGTAFGAGLYQRFCRTLAFGVAVMILLLGLSTTCLLGGFALAEARKIYDFARATFGDSFWGVLTAEMTVAASVFALPTIFMGAAFSHLVQSSRRDHGGIGRAVAFNTLGSALAPLVFGVLLLPALGAKWSLVALAAAYLVLAASPLVAQPVARAFGLLETVAGGEDSWGRKGTAETGQTQRNAGAVSSLRPYRLRGIFWARSSVVVPLGLIALLPQRLQFVQPPPGGKLLEYRAGTMESVAVVEHFDGHRSLMVNNRFTMGGTGAADAARRHAHIPLLLHPKPEKALFLGLGTGITLAAAGTHARVMADGVELVPEIPEVLHYFEPYNRRHSGLRVHVADARRFVRVTDERYDVIVADLFHPARDGAGTLYTVEHFQAVRARLAPGGIFCQWLPLYQLGDDMLRVVVRTFLEVFPDSHAWLLRFNVDTPVLGLIAHQVPKVYPPDWFGRRVVDPALAKELRSVNLPDGLHLFGCYLAGPKLLRDFSGSAPLNSDDYPVVMFRAPEFAFRRQETPYGRLLSLLDRAEIQTPVLIGQDGSGTTRTFAEELTKFIGARDIYLRGLVAESEGHRSQAIDAYVESARASENFTTSYARCLTLAMQQAKSKPDEARRLLQRLAEAQPARPVAGELLKRLSP